MAGALQRGLHCTQRPMARNAASSSGWVMAVPSKARGCHSPASSLWTGGAAKARLRPGDQRGRDRHQRFFRLSRFDRQLFGPACSAALALSSQRADLALWRTVGQADQRPQFHQRLVIRAGAFLGHFFQHTAVNSRLAAGLVISAELLSSRANTRSTLPSTAGAGMPNAMEAIAPAV